MNFQFTGMTRIVSNLTSTEKPIVNITPSERSLWLPCCWSRLTQDEFVATIVPLFEKKITPYDVGRLSLVLILKKCAEVSL